MRVLGKGEGRVLSVVGWIGLLVMVSYFTLGTDYGYRCTRYERHDDFLLNSSDSF